jgi:hypothetical protein
VTADSPALMERMIRCRCGKEFESKKNRSIHIQLSEICRQREEAALRKTLRILEASRHRVVQTSADNDNGKGFECHSNKARINMIHIVASDVSNFSSGSRQVDRMNDPRQSDIRGEDRDGLDGS